MGTRHFFTTVDPLPYCEVCKARQAHCVRCKGAHCKCKICLPRPRKDTLVVAKVGHRTMCLSAARVRHLQGASRGGLKTASQPNPGRFTSETGSKTAKNAWDTNWRHIRIGSRWGSRIGKRLPRIPRVTRPIPVVIKHVVGYHDGIKAARIAAQKGTV
jgi:hypothetical protein